MSDAEKNSEDPKDAIIAQVAALSELLGMIPSDDTVEIHAPLIGKKMVLSDWLSATRNSFLKLSILISKELDIQLQ